MLAFVGYLNGPDRRADQQQLTVIIRRFQTGKQVTRSAAAPTLLGRNLGGSYGILGQPSQMQTSRLNGVYGESGARPCLCVYL